MAFSWLRCRQGLTDLGEEDLGFFNITIFQMQTYSQAGRTVPKGLVYQLKREKLFRVTPGHASCTHSRTQPRTQGAWPSGGL